ncbi:MAG: glycosyltransferase [Gemmatimonadetes bacterium]|nr:glycosyltransferase [Gemmatimonadota bacterium]
MAVPTVSVLVPTWRRPESLARCLRALAAQSQPPVEIVVGWRADDSETALALATLTLELGVPVRQAMTAEPGVVAAMNAALELCTGTVIALTDDDAEPRPDWLERLGRCFDDPAVGGAGGRDWQPTERGSREEVGRIQWFGRVIGHHHLGVGPARPVDVLKGVNAAFRAPLLRTLRFDSRLQGAGAQMFWELALCLPLRRAGWTLVYDPAIAVEHHIEPRHDADQRHRGTFVPEPQVQAVHNETLILLEHQRGFRRLAFIAWALLVGTRMEPGLAQIPRLWLMGDALAVARWRWTLVGRVRGWKSWCGSGGDPARSVPRPTV